MSDERIVIEVSADGRTVKVEGQGIVGTDCKLLTAAIERALGTVQTVVTKPEYHLTRAQGRTVGR